MLPIISALLTFVAGLFRSWALLCLAQLILRHQVVAYKQTIYRPQLRPTDRLFLASLSRLWPGWPDALACIPPRRVIAWPPQRFRDYWRHLNQQGKLRRPAVTRAVETLMQHTSRANLSSGATRIVGELRTWGIDVAISIVEKYRVHPWNSPSPRWKAFLKNRVQDLVTLDYFPMPTVTPRVLFVLRMLIHHRRRIVPINVTEHPTTPWTAQQVVEAFRGMGFRALCYGIAMASMIRTFSYEPTGLASKQC